MYFPLGYSGDKKKTSNATSANHRLEVDTPHFKTTTTWRRHQQLAIEDSDGASQTVRTQQYFVSDSMFVDHGGSVECQQRTQSAKLVVIKYATDIVIYNTIL